MRVTTRWARGLFPWMSLGRELETRWLWIFRAAWVVGMLVWVNDADRSPRGLLGFFVLFFMVGNSLDPQRVTKYLMAEKAVIAAFSILFFNGVVAFVPVKNLIAIFLGYGVNMAAFLYAVIFHAAVFVFVVMWLRMLRHQRSKMLGG